MEISMIVIFALVLITAIATSFGTSAIKTERDALQRLRNTRKLSSTGHSRNKRQIYPGTKWCGVGNNAESYEDLGKHEKADRCCRTHDKCDISIRHDETKYGVKNTGKYTLSSCSCDRDFYNCLKYADCDVADNVGIFYFNGLKMDCLGYKDYRFCFKLWKRKLCRTLPRLAIVDRNKEF